MSGGYYDECPEPDGYCEQCGVDLDEDGDHDETHRKCWACWRAENSPEPERDSWRRPAPAAPGHDERIDALEGRVDHLELTNKALIGLAVSLGRRVDACELDGPLSTRNRGAA